MDWQLLKRLPQYEPGRGWGIQRTAIPGGWLVLFERGEAGGLTFVPDQYHSWNGESVTPEGGPPVFIGGKAHPFGTPLPHHPRPVTPDPVSEHDDTRDPEDEDW